MSSDFKSHLPFPFPAFPVVTKQPVTMIIIFLIFLLRSCLIYSRKNKAIKTSSLCEVIFIVKYILSYHVLFKIAFVLGSSNQIFITGLSPFP